MLQTARTALRQLRQEENPVWALLAAWQTRAHTEGHQQTSDIDALQYAVQLVERFIEEFKAGIIHYIARYALVKATAKTHIRQSQERLILTKIAHRLQHDLGTAQFLADCQHILNTARSAPQSYQNYIAGNLLNLLRIATIRPTYLDCSLLTISQAFLQSTTWPGINFRNAHFENTVFTESFSIISAIALSPDGSQLAAAAVNGEIRIWDTKTRQLQLLFLGHNAYISSVAFRNDNQLLVTASNDGTIKFWDSTNAQMIATLRSHIRPVSVVVFSPKGDKFISAGYEPDLLVWNVVSRQVECRLQGHCGRIGAVAYHPWQDIVASGDIDGVIRLWAVVDGRCLKEWQGHTHIVQDLKFSPDGKFLASSSHDETLRLWDLASLRCCHTWFCAASDVSPVAFGPNNRILASPGRNFTVNLWDIVTGNLFHVLLGHTSNIRGLAFHPDGTKLYRSSEDISLGVWDVHWGQPVEFHQGYLNRVQALTFGRDDGELCTSSTVSGIQRWTISDSIEVRPIDAITNSSVVATNPKGDLLAYEGDNRTVCLFDLQSNRCRFVLTGHTSSIRTLVFDASGDLLISGGRDHSVRVWRVATGENLHVSDCTIRLWDPQTCLQESVLEGHKADVLTLSFSNLTGILTSAGSDQVIKLWRISTGEVLRTLEGHTRTIWKVATSHNGKVIASCADDGIKLWNVEDGASIHSLQASGPYKGVPIKA